MPLARNREGSERICLGCCFLEDTCTEVVCRDGPQFGTMRIACLQFDPQLGEVDNNLNRADAVLEKVDAADLDGLDLLVLPELAFTGT